MTLDLAEFWRSSSRMFAISPGRLSRVPRRFWSVTFRSRKNLVKRLKVACRKRLRQNCFHILGWAPVRVHLHRLGVETEGAACRNARVRTLISSGHDLAAQEHRGHPCSPVLRPSALGTSAAAKTSSRLIKLGSSHTVSSSSPYIVVGTDAGVRCRGDRATIEELAKLQGFDDAIVDFLVLLAIGSPQNVRGFIANAVPPPVAALWCELLLPLKSRD